MKPCRFAMLVAGVSLLAALTTVTEVGAVISAELEARLLAKISQLSTASCRSGATSYIDYYRNDPNEPCAALSTAAAKAEFLALTNCNETDYNIALATVCDSAAGLVVSLLAFVICLVVSNASMQILVA